MSPFFQVIVGGPGSKQSCWNDTEASLHGPNPIMQAILNNVDNCCPHGISSELTFYHLWINFTRRATSSLNSAYRRHKHAPPSKIQQWGGGVAGGEPTLYNLFGNPKYFLAACPPEKFMLQVWDMSADSQAKNLIRYGYDVVLSNPDFTYLDCGASGWVGPGGYWCKTYLEWYTIYDYLPAVRKQWNMTSREMMFIKGAETLQWGEIADGNNFMQRIWPRSAALGERLWTDPASSALQADPRMHMHRQRLVQRGIPAEALQPAWCLQHGSSCTKEDNFAQTTADTEPEKATHAKDGPEPRQAMHAAQMYGRGFLDKSFVNYGIVHWVCVGIVIFILFTGKKSWCR